MSSDLTGAATFKIGLTDEDASSYVQSKQRHGGYTIGRKGGTMDRRALARVRKLGEKARPAELVLADPLRTQASAAARPSTSSFAPNASS